MEEIRSRLKRFVEEREWEQFHNPKDLAIALNIETSELLDNYLWKDFSQADKAKVREELGDVFIYAIMMADKYGWDVFELVLEKITLNEQKYPTDKVKGKAVKWNKI